MAVAYEEKLCYCGQVVKKLKKKVLLTFLTEINEGVFSWPEKEDKDLVGPEFIFCCNLEALAADPERKTYCIKNLKEIQNKFEAFYCKYFTIV